MTIVVVGPSRAGKSTLIREVLGEFPILRLLDLDAEDDRRVSAIRTSGGDPGGWNNRWCRSLQIIGAAESGGAGDLVVDVGAGALQTLEGRCFFISRGPFAISVYAPCAVVFSRHPGRDPEEFRQTEYSAEREEVYRSARITVSTTGGVEESTHEFRRAIRNLLALG